MSTMASQSTSLTIVHITVYLVADQRKHQSTASLAFVRGIHQWLMNSPHKGPVTRKMFPLDDVIMEHACSQVSLQTNHFAWYFIYQVQLFQMANMIVNLGTLSDNKTWAQFQLHQNKALLALELSQQADQQTDHRLRQIIWQEIKFNFLWKGCGDVAFHMETPGPISQRFYEFIIQIL